MSLWSHSNWPWPLLGVAGAHSCGTRFQACLCKWGPLPHFPSSRRATGELLAYLFNQGNSGFLCLQRCVPSCIPLVHICKQENPGRYYNLILIPGACWIGSAYLGKLEGVDTPELLIILKANRYLPHKFISLMSQPQILDICDTRRGMDNSWLGLCDTIKKIYCSIRVMAGDPVFF